MAVGGQSDVAGALRIDPLAPAHPGRWEDGSVVVCHTDRAAVPVRVVANRRPDVVTGHFEVHRVGGRTLVLHRLRPDELDDDIAGLIAGELAAPGVVTSAADFERVFTGLIRSTVSDPLTAWSTFYANTLATLRAPDGPVDPGAPPESSLAAFAPVHERAVAEIAGATVLDLGSCFGFLPLRLADEGFTVTASDHTVGTMGLLAAVAPRLAARHRARPVRTLVCDARAIPAPDAAVDTVTAVHLLEHLPADDTERLVDEMCRVARRRVVVAVPYEDTPDPVYGHLRRFDAADLGALADRARRGGWTARVTDDHGGWLVCER